MSSINTNIFLPDVFKTSTNQRFLGATLDQLVGDAQNSPLNGYIGRTFAPTYKLGDNYVPELNSNRTNYQLEPSVVVRESNDISFSSGYVDVLRAISNNDGFVNNHQRLFDEQSYDYDGRFDYDKFVNYNNYYWLPNGPAPVGIYSNDVPYQADYTVTRNTADDGYVFSKMGSHANPQLSLARGGTYTFTVNQPGFKFWIQSEPGTSGTKENLPTITTRDIFGVKNNGTDVGTVTFKVPLASAQDFYLRMTLGASVDVATDLPYTAIHGRLLSEFLAEYPEGLDGINNQLQNKTLIFLGGQVDDVYWTSSDFGVIGNPTRSGAWRINLIPAGSDYTIQLDPRTVTVVNEKEKVFVRSGKTYTSTEFWLNNAYQYSRVPEITATADYLYYQDSSNPDFIGEIKIVDNKNVPINVTKDIIGSKGYTSPNGVVFTNGLKIEFDSSVLPSAYAGKQYYVEGVGSSIELVPVDQLVVPELFGDNIDVSPDYITISRGSQDRNAWSRYNRWFHVDVLNSTATYNNTVVDYGPNITGRRPIIEFEAGLQLIKHGTLAKPTADLIAFESPAEKIVEGGSYKIIYVGTTDFTTFGATSNAVGVSFVATRDGTGADGTGTTTTDAFNQVEGQATATVDGVTLVNNQRIIFANDYDINVRSKVWRVSIEYINSSNYIRLVEDEGDASVNDNVLISNGSHRGQSYYYDGSNWLDCQAKTSVNQPPLFDIVDANGYSFSDSTVYTGTNFAGTRNFGYKVGTGTDDPVLGFPLSYQNFNNIGDIVFNNYYDSDSFVYADGTIEVNSGYFVVNKNSTATKVNNWAKTVERSKQYQVFTKFFDGKVVTIDGVERAYVQIDVLPTNQKSIPYIKVYLNNTLLVEGVDYQLNKAGVYNIVELFSIPAVGDKIDALVYSLDASKLGYYEVPKNLDLNPLNENFTTITLGQLRNHYNKLIENYAGSKPLQDTYIKSQGGTLVQHSAPAIYSIAFLNDPLVNFTNGLALARKEYSRFKNKFLTLAATLTNLDYTNPVASVDAILQNINANKNSNFSWYYSDMVPQGGDYNVINYTVLNAQQTDYEIYSIFDVTELSNRAVIVYVNNVQQVRDLDYTFSTVAPAITFLKTLEFGDKIEIRDYFNTDGNYIPETPTKLGLYPKFAPSIFLDTTYRTPVNVIQGHDGSITPAFGDFRDDFLLELEKRIYNNIKTEYTKNEIDLYNIIPGRFRTTDYSLAEINQLLSQYFLSWAGTNTVNFADNSSYDQYDTWTWNYAGCKDLISGSSLQGSWRAVYRYWFDTDRPHTHPWEMLGLEVEPSWWQDRYGPAPYTGGNFTLWEDLEAGYIWNNGDSYVDSRFVRPGLTGFVPVDSAGNLLSPYEIPLTRQTNGNGTYAVGEQGPVETAWRRSSDYPYAVQLALALAKPAEYFATQYDTSQFELNPVTGEFTRADNKKISPTIISVNGDTTTDTVKRTSGYINWIADSIKNLGIDPVSKLNEYFANLSVQLCYKVGGFTDKNMITVSAEQTSPGSKNASVIIPDGNYHLYLSKSVPTLEISYSAVIVEKSPNGYTISGYDLANPFFKIIPSVVNNNSSVLTIGSASVKIYQDSSRQFYEIPYGTEFTNIQQVADFLISYERSLAYYGFIFNEFDKDLQDERNWILSVKEFLSWSTQGWTNGTIIVLNPVVDKLKVRSYYSTVDEIDNTQFGSRVLDQNFNPIRINNFSVVRGESIANGNNFVLTVLDGTTICYAHLKLVQYEHILVLDNVSDFGDIIYMPKEGTRQYRLKLSGSRTGNWTGALSAQGYIYNDPTVNSWQANTDYKIGDVVKFNNNYYTSTNNIPASSQFNPASWTKIPKSAIQTGLLPNFGHNAQKFENIYDIDRPPQEENLQLFGAGLIGFRERPYLTDLGMSIPNQTKFYQGYIKQKGTQNSISSLTKASFDNVGGTINTYEEWAFLAGQYGDLDNNQYKEFILDQSLFRNNPVAFTSSDNFAVGNVIMTLNGNAISTDIGGNINSNVYTSSNLLSSTTTLYGNRTLDFYKSDLISAGYVNLADIDSQIFNIKDVTTNDILDVGAGHKIWTAKDIDGNWNVYRVNETGILGTRIAYTLDDYAQINFNLKHSFAPGDMFVITDFKTGYVDFSNVYVVQSVPNSLSVTVKMKLKENDLTYLIKNSPITTSSGLVYKLGSVRVDSVDQLPELTPLYGWDDGDRVWVDNATETGWGVYTYNRAWLSNTETTISHTSFASGRFGSAVAFDETSSYVYVGEPGSNKVIVNNVAANTSTTISSSDSNFGSSIASAKNILAVTSGTNVKVYTVTNGTATSVQTIGNVGVSVTMSSDGHWLYIGNDTTNKVYSYWTDSVSSPSYSYVGAISQKASAVKTNSNGTKIFIADPSATNVDANNGNVYVYTRTANSFSLTQTLSSQHKNAGARFGTSIDIDGTAGNLFVGIPGSTASGEPNGIVERYTLSSGTYTFKEYLHHPGEEPGAFGSVLSVSSDNSVVAIGSAGSTGREETTFDVDTTVIDAKTTKFVDEILNSGAVYLFEPLVNHSVSDDLGQYVYTQDLETQVNSQDSFGCAVAVGSGVIAVGASGTNSNAGQAYLFYNPDQLSVWQITRQKQSIVDINSISRTFVYNKLDNNILAVLDYVDPNKGKVLNAADKDIDYKRDRDPALYNAGKQITLHEDYHWGPEQIGKIWWNLDTVRYIDYEQDSLTYRLNHWGERFPGSSINVYEWVESLVLPSQYIANGGVGTPLHSDDSAYSTFGYIDQTGTVKLKYYYWVSGLDRANVDAGKSNSVYSIAAVIENPQSQGIPYATVLRDDTVALYNINHLLTGQTSVVHIGGRASESAMVHSEYALVQEGNPRSQLPQNILSKLIDSLSGQDAIGNTVPDPLLTPAQAYGISVRPRQTMFIDTALAWKNYVTIVNNKLFDQPIAKRKVLTTLNSGEVAPNAKSGEYNLTVSTVDELGYIRTEDDLGSLVSPFDVDGYRVLVTTDTTQNTKWAIYEWDSTNRAWNIATRTDGSQWVQSYKTDLYWSYIDWYDSSFNSTTNVDYTVDTQLDFGKLTLVADTYVKVLDAGDGKFAVYYIDSDLNKSIVGIESGTIQIDTGTVPSKETRQIMTAIQNEILIDDLAADFNDVFFTLIKYALTEQKNIDWAFKTSFLSATQYLRKLEKFPAYISDNQDYYLNYINEVKPYRTILREYVVDYERLDPYSGDVTDFDIAPYWDGNLQVYRSPNGTQSYDADLLSSGSNSQWHNNYLYRVIDIIVEDGGSDYLFDPEITIAGGGGTGATATAAINGNGQVASITIVTPGYGYYTEPNVIINGTGSGARARAVLRNVYDGNNSGHNLIRSVTSTIKFDRVNYESTNVFIMWDSITTANIGEAITGNVTMVNLNNQIYRVTADCVITGNVDLGTVDFPIDCVEAYNPANFNNANDRITAFKGNINLATTQDGLEYPGVIVEGNTYVGTDIDSIISPLYATNFGINAADIYIDGGQYVDRYESHAPEELVPGRMFDSLNISVYTNNDANLEAVTQTIAYRIFDNMSAEHSFYRISAANSTVLTEDLSLTDTEIHVEDVTGLLNPNPELAIPGVVFINGEKIYYYSRDTDTNTLGQIRRAVDGTSPFTTHLAGTAVVDSSFQQAVTNAETSTVELGSSTEYNSTDTVTYRLTLDTAIVANIGDYITQDGTTANLRVLETITSNTIAVSYETVDTLTADVISVNGVETEINFESIDILGLVDINGNVNVEADNTLTTSFAWYNLGPSVPVDQSALFNSVSAQALFLKLSGSNTP